MRILTLSNCPLEEDQGSGYVVLGYARRLRERGHEVDVIGPRELELPRWGSRAHRYRQMLGMAALASKRQARGYDVMEFYGGEAWLALSLLRRARRRPLLVARSNGLEPHVTRHMRDAASAEAWYRFDLSSLYARGFRLADALVMVSEFDRSYALEHAYQAPERLLAIDNPLPAQYLGQPFIAERPPAAVFCGSWIARKGTALLARDATTFLQSHPQWRLVLAGVGEAYRAADHFVPAVLGQIEVVPRAERSGALRDIFRRCRIVIQSSLYESFGLVAAEAMACGCALVATAVGFAHGLVDGEEACLLPSPASPQLAAALARLAGDEPLRRRIAEGGYRRVQQLRWEPAIDRLESAYRDWHAARHAAVA